jgi:hypothetical protein
MITKRKRTAVIITVFMVVVSLSLVRMVLGRIYRMNDGCTSCGQQRTWLSFDGLGPRQFALTITADGDRQHQHQYWDATWISQFWFWESSWSKRASLQAQ